MVQFARLVGFSLLFSLGLGSVMSAENFDGLYYPEGQSYLCDDNLYHPGETDGLSLIDGDKYLSVESSCEFSNASNLQDLHAVLIDVKCMSEGEADNYRMMLLQADGGIYKITKQMVLFRKKCLP